jgi:ribonuclease HII
VELQIETEVHKTLWELDKRYWEKGETVCGVADVGAEAIIGGIYAVAAIMNPEKVNKNLLPFIHRSKIICLRPEYLLTRTELKLLSPKILGSLFEISWGEIGIEEINKYYLRDIQKARIEARQRALMPLLKKMEAKKKTVDILLQFDFLLPTKEPIEQRLVDSQVMSGTTICAGILARLLREGFIKELGQKDEFKKYNLKKNLGYPTPDHIKAIKAYGPSKIHRPLIGVR